MQKKKLILFMAVFIFIATIITACGGDKSNNANTKMNVNKFQTTNLDGHKITQNIFRDFDITMINVFATWCNPCIGELPELAEVHNMMPENTNLLGICGDAGEDAETLALAKKIITEKNVSFDVLLPDENLQKNLLAHLDYYPTTILVDRQGNIVGKPIIGVPNTEDVAEYYLLQIHSTLDALGK